MILDLNLIIQDNQFHFIPKIHLHLPAFEEDFSVFSMSWLCFNFIMTTREIIAMSTYWREIVKEAVMNDEEKMEKLESLVSTYAEYTDEEFSHKAKYILNGIL